MERRQSRTSDSPVFCDHMFFTNKEEMHSTLIPFPANVRHLRQLHSGQWDIKWIICEWTQNEPLKGLNISLLHVPINKLQFYVVRRIDGGSCALVWLACPHALYMMQDITYKHWPCAWMDLPWVPEHIPQSCSPTSLYPSCFPFNQSF